LNFHSDQISKRTFRIFMSRAWDVMPTAPKDIMWIISSFWNTQSCFRAFLKALAFSFSFPFCYVTTTCQVDFFHSFNHPFELFLFFFPAIPCISNSSFNPLTSSLHVLQPLRRRRVDLLSPKASGKWEKTIEKWWGGHT
jgi:hypothetical protein